MISIVDAFAAIRTDARIKALAELLGSDKGPVIAEGLWGSCAPILAALASQRLGCPLLLLTSHADDADEARDDIETVLGTLPELLPQLDTTPTDTEASDELAGERLRLCLRLLDLDPETGWQRASSSDATEDDIQPPPIIIAPILALMQPVATPESIAEQSLTIETGDSFDPDRLAQWLAERGFERCDQVEVPGDFSRRWARRSQRYTLLGCSRSRVMTTLSPARQSSALTAAFRPSETFFITAIWSGPSALIRRAKRPRISCRIWLRCFLVPVPYSASSSTSWALAMAALLRSPRVVEVKYSRPSTPG